MAVFYHVFLLFKQWEKSKLIGSFVKTTNAVIYVHFVWSLSKYFYMHVSTLGKERIW